MTNFVRKAALAASAVAVLAATPALAASSDTKQLTATATIMKPITLTKTSDLDFGTITMGNTLVSSTVVIDRTGGRTCGNGSGTDLTCTSTPTAAAFDASGVASQGVDLTYSALSALTSGSDTLGFALDGPATLSLGVAGTGSFGVGGTVTVLGSTKDGVYSGTVDVTATYQ